MKKFIATLIFVCVLTAGVFGQTADEWFQRANDYYNRGDYANAITAYSETIRRDSSDLEAYWFRGIAYYQIRNYDACIADCTTVINGAPDFSTVYVIRGDAYGAKGIYHKAVADFSTGLGIGYDPSNFNVDKSNNSDMWFCGAIYMEIAVNRFLGNSSVVTRYENLLNTVCNRNGVTRAEIETFYRNNVHNLIVDVADNHDFEFDFNVLISLINLNFIPGGFSYGGLFYDKTTENGLVRFKRSEDLWVGQTWCLRTYTLNNFSKAVELYNSFLMRAFIPNSWEFLEDGRNWNTGLNYDMFRKNGYTAMIVIHSPDRSGNCSMGLYITNTDNIYDMAGFR